MKTTNRIKFVFFGVLLFVLISGGCASVKIYRDNFNPERIEGPPYPDVSFAVMTDLHIWHPSLGSPSDPAYQRATRNDGKLLQESIELLDNAISVIIDAGVSFVLVCGDLTKDGELYNHEVLSEKLKRLSDANIKVMVIPGNHDIYSGNATRLTGNMGWGLPSVSYTKFSEIYYEYGFSQAIMRDSDSLSYVTEPVDGLWVLSIDSNRYRDKPRSWNTLGDGRIRPLTVSWIAEVLNEAQIQNKSVIAMMHHRLVPYEGVTQERMEFYLVRDYESVGELLASWNVRVIFTGHNHNQSINRASFGDKYIVDIQTGSLIAGDCPFRIVDIKDNVMNISSHSARIDQPVTVSDQYFNNIAF
ncbi:MAG: metallophosphoesterase [Treponema sp.]|nr:metallophosphoesterase [Treponema sp.]